MSALQIQYCPNHHKEIINHWIYDNDRHTGIGFCDKCFEELKQVGTLVMDSNNEKWLKAILDRMKGVR